MTWAYFVKGHIRIFGNFTCNPLTFVKGLLCEGTRRFEARLCWFCTLLYLQQRRNQTKYRELLAQRAQQFRTIQRRLLTRFKDKTPAPLANLDTLLDGTYRQVIKFKKKYLNSNILVTYCVYLRAAFARRLSIKRLCLILSPAFSVRRGWGGLWTSYWGGSC